MPLCAVACVMLGCLSFQSGVSMELSCLGQTSGSRGREPWVNFKLLPPSMTERERGPVRLFSSIPVCYYFMNIVNVTVPKLHIK